MQRRRSTGCETNEEDDVTFQPCDLLHLFLGQHQHVQAPPDTLRFLSIRELMLLLCVNKKLRNTLLSTTRGCEYTKCRDGKTYPVPFPGFPGALETPADLEHNAGLYPHQLASLRAMQTMENRSSIFGSLRGGILGDAPGLGKTISVLSLVASTAGRYPVEPTHPGWDNDKIQEGWRSLRKNPSFREDVNRLWHRLLRLYPDCKTIRSLISYCELPWDNDDRFQTHQHFQSFVSKTLRGVVSGNELELFRSDFRQLLTKLDKDQRGFFSSKEGRRFHLEQCLYRSSATLIVVPDALLEHWYEQFVRHLDMERFCNHPRKETGTPSGVIYIDGVGDISTASIPLNIDLEARMPVLDRLAHYLVFLVPFSRCEREFKRESDLGRFAKASTSTTRPVKRQRRSARKAPTTVEASTSTKKACSPILKIRWLRLIVDEGHELGGSEASVGLTNFIHEIAAERRWVLSGTPTTGNRDHISYTADALDQLQRLLCFLRHPVYGTVPNNEASVQESSNEVLALQQWGIEIKQPFLNRDDAARCKLLEILKEFMVMHRKEDIKLPLPIFISGEVQVDIPKAIQQMVLRAPDPMSARRKLDRYIQTSGFQSLVDQAQGEYIVKSIHSAKNDVDRAAKAGGVNQRPVKAVVYSTSSNDLQSVAEIFYKHFDSENIAEMYGNAKDLSNELVRFQHGFRLTKTCPICCHCNENSTKGFKSCQNRLLEVVALDNPNQRFLVERERIVDVLRAVAHPNSDPASYRADTRLWRPKDELAVDIRDPHPLLPKRRGAAVWHTWGSEKCVERAKRHLFCGREWYFGPLPVIANDDEDHTQGRRFRVRLEKFQKCGAFHGSWYAGPSLSKAPEVRVEEDVTLLCLYSGISHGLDLSSVTHIYLLEPIEDAALLEQVTSRAHRLGATGPVKVETINVWQGLSDEVIQATKSSRAPSSKDKAVCRFCCRTFASAKIASEHEATNCPSNPDARAGSDEFNIHEIYRQIRPPLVVDFRT